MSMLPTQSTQSTQSTQGTQGGTFGPTTYTIAGVKVEFPTKAYPSQLAMMHKVIQGLKQNKNCLLESPTGSGKTLALLCAALAWQRHEAVRVAEYNAAIDARQEAIIQQQKQKRKSFLAAQQQIQKQIQDDQPQEHQNPETSCGETATAITESKDPLKAAQQNSPKGLDSPYFPDPNIPVMELTDDEDDFKPAKRNKSSISNNCKSPQQMSVMADEPINEKLNNTKPEPKPDEPYWVAPEKKQSVPKIYFGTRTHKQIAQITRELRKTFYKSVRSVILASREHTCINPMLEKMSNKNEHCRELLDNKSDLGEGCIYHVGAKKFGSFGSLVNYSVHPGYDLEDLVKAGREAKACPYYATRFLMTNADLIFCPYNYMIDPSIRRSMNIDLANQIIIFDEAHNMEDAAREAASFVLRQHEVTKAMQDCEKVKNIGGAEPYALGEMANLLSTMSVWIDEQSSNLRELSYNTSGKCWTGTEAIASLHTAGLIEEKVKLYESYFKAIKAQRDKDIDLAKERGVRFQFEKPSISSLTTIVIENVFQLFEELHKNNGRNRDDFRIALIKSTEKRRRDGNSGPFQSFTVFTVNVWCLNPAIAFAEIRDQVHSIVLTSGTLSPMQSFESELGTPFSFRLEASHVIDQNQVWAGVLGVGPNGVNLNGSYQNTESLGYQDEIGAVIQFVCDTMPYGVLCFFPSYRMMDKMVERWQMTKRYSKIEAKKQIIVEPRTGAADFETAMNQFYNAVKSCDGENQMGGITGALFLAVCRGKVSEGLDFSDNNARAVICIGIPFPNYRDMQVELKRNYNQQNMSRGLLSGGDWYEIQAFRALNQALGRCIRHRQDWGAIFLIDDRYAKTPRYIGSLSKWIRHSVMSFESFREVPRSLEQFRNEMIARPIPTETSFGTQTQSGTSILGSDSTVIREGGGDEGNAVFGSALQFGMNTGVNGDLHLQKPLVSFENAFSSGDSSISVDDTPTDLDCKADLSFEPLTEVDFNPNPRPSRSAATMKPYSNFTRASGSSTRDRGRQTNSPAFKTSAIGAMFARQRPKTETNSNSSNLNQASVDNGISEPNRNKRAREKKIRL